MHGYLIWLTALTGQCSGHGYWYRLGLRGATGCPLATWLACVVRLEPSDLLYFDTSQVAFGSLCRAVTMRLRETILNATTRALGYDFEYVMCQNSGRTLSWLGVSRMI